MSIRIARRLLPIALSALVALAACSSTEQGSENDDGNALTSPVATNPVNDDGSATAPDTHSPTRAGDALALDRDYGDLLYTLGGYPMEALSDEILLIGDTIVAGAGAGAGAGTPLAPGTIAVMAFGEPVDGATERSIHDCPLGGTVTADIGRLQISEPSYSNVAEQDRYEFDQCRLDLDGEQLLHGSVRVKENNVSASRGAFADKDVEWIDFRWQQGESGLLAGTGSVLVRALLSFNEDSSRTVSIGRFERVRDSRSIERAIDGSMTLSIGTLGNGAFEIYGLQVSGTVSDASDVDVRVITEQPFTAQLAAASLSDQGEAFGGRLTMDADDGSRLTVTAQPVTNMGPKPVELEYIAADGRTVRTDGQDIVELPLRLR